MSYTSQIFSDQSASGLRIRRPVGGPAKRWFDIVFALAAIVGLLPLLIGCCIVVLVTSPGPVLFRHRRIGFGGQSFDCLKFRTMVVDAEDRLREYLAEDPDAQREWQAAHKLKNDPRVTPFGQFMRRSSLDELPQLINVLTGEMSLVGPRPIVIEEMDKYQDHFHFYAAGRPGITGLWQVKGRNTTTYAQRVAYDVEYLRNWSFIRDIRIVLLTVAHVISGRGAY